MRMLKALPRSGTNGWRVPTLDLMRAATVVAIVCAVMVGMIARASGGANCGSMTR